MKGINLLSLVRLLGDMMLSFPAGIVSVFTTNPNPAPLQFRILNAGRLESVLPNKQLITKVKNACTDSVLVYEFNMNNLQELLVKQSQLNPQVASQQSKISSLQHCLGFLLQH